MHYNTNITYTNMTKGLRHTRLALNLLYSQGRLLILDPSDLHFPRDYRHFPLSLIYMVLENELRDNAFWASNLPTELHPQSPNILIFEVE